MDPELKALDTAACDANPPAATGSVEKQELSPAQVAAQPPQAARADATESGNPAPPAGTESAKYLAKLASGAYHRPKKEIVSARIWWTGCCACPGGLLQS